jgi:hypothetical protein
MTHRVQLFAAAVIAPYWLLVPVLAAPPATDESAPPPEQPADAKARLAAKLEKHRKKYGDGMLYDVDEKLKIIFVMATDQRTLDEIKQRLSAHAEALQRDLFKYGIKDYLSVIVPRKWANPKVTGHFYPDLVDAATVGCNLMHEFTHALHYADQVGRDQYQPVWLMEGIASMYENSEVVAGHVVPRVNHRLIELQQEVKGNKHLPFAKMMKLERRQFTSHQYAQANYMCMYLQATGQLPQWYAAYNEGFVADSSGIAATEHIYGKNINEVEKAWVAWLLQLDPPRVFPGPGAAGLGIAGKQLPDAVEIAQLAPQGAADKAGLAIGDALIRVAGERTIEQEDLLRVVGRHKAGDSVKIEYRRNGEYREISATLTPLTAFPQAPPESLPAKSL